MKSFLETPVGQNLIVKGKNLDPQSLWEEDHEKRIVNYAAATCYFLSKNPNIYYFSPDFSSALKEVALDIPIANVEIPNGLILIELTEKSEVTFKGRPITHLIVFEAQECINSIYFCGSKIVQAINVSKSHHTNVTSKSLETYFMQRCPLPDAEEAMQLYRFLINALVYIKSGDPDLRDYTPPKKPANFSGRERAWVRANRENSLYPMTLVGFGYKKPNLRHVDESAVTGHFRWQPYGTGRTQVKLIWISAHVRKYEKPVDQLDVAPT